MQKLAKKGLFDQELARFCPVGGRGGDPDHHNHGFSHLCYFHLTHIEVRIYRTTKDMLLQENQNMIGKFPPSSIH